jgi:integrase
MSEAVRHGAGKEGGAVKAQLAVTIELLLHIPLRMANLISLRFGQELVRAGGPGTPHRIVIEGPETKNGEPLEFRLSPDLSAMIDRYRADFHPVFSGPDNPFLFPSRTDGHKAQATLSQQIKKTVLERTGLVLTGHQFRHLAGRIYLRAHPADFVTVQKLLGHRNLKTTMNAYAELDTATAAQRYDELITETRAKPRPARKPRRR